MKVNQLKAGVLLSYASELVNVVIGLVYTPIMLRLLGQSQYGLYQLCASVISYMSLLSLGFGSSYVRFYSKYKVNDDREGIARLNGMFMTIFIIIGIVCAAAGAVLVFNVDTIFKSSLTADEVGTARILMALMIFNLAISFPGSVFSSHITAHEQYIFQKVVMILRNICNPCLTLPLLLMGYGSVAMVVIQTVLSLAALAANMIFCGKKLGMKFDFRKFELPLLKSLFMFSFWIFLNQIIDQINWNADKFILGMFSGTEAVAVYAVGAQLNNLYMEFSTSITGVFAPKVNLMVAEKNDDGELTDLMTRVGRIQFMILMLVLSGFIIFGKYFIKIWAGDGYDEAYRIVLLLLIPVTIPLSQGLGLEIQRAKNLHYMRSIIYLIIAVSNVFLSIPLAKLYGGTGAAMGTAAALLAGNGIIMNIIYQTKIGLNIIYFWKNILKFIPALILPGVCGFLIMRFVSFSGIASFGGFILGYTVLYCASMYFIGMNSYERGLITKPIMKILKRG